MRVERQGVSSKEVIKVPQFDVLIVGGGVGGIGATISLLDRMRQQRVPLSVGIVEPDKLGGRLGENKITANSPAFDFIEDVHISPVRNSLHHPSGRRLQEISNRSKTEAPTLPEVGAFYTHALATELKKELGESAVINRHVSSIVVTGEHCLVIDQGGKAIAKAKDIVLATGGREELLLPLETYQDKTALSQEIFKEEKLDEMKRKLLAVPFDKRKVVIVGNRDGGWALVYKLLEDLQVDLPERAIEVLARRPTKVYFDTAEEASALGYRFENNDICPKTGRVNRFGSIQQNAKEIYLNVALGNEKRVTITPYNHLEEMESLFTEATYIVQSAGLKTNVVPLFDGTGNMIGPLISEKGKVQLSPRAQLLGLDGNPIPYIYGIGVGYDGIKPTPEIGGQPNYDGSLHAGNIYRLTVGPMIAQQVMP